MIVAMVFTYGITKYRHNRFWNQTPALLFKFLRDQYLNVTPSCIGDKCNFLPKPLLINALGRKHEYLSSWKDLLIVNKILGAPREENCHNYAEGTVGSVVSVTEKGFVVVNFDPDNIQNVVEFELDELQFYSGTTFLEDFLKNWSWGNAYIMESGKCRDTRDSGHRSPTLHPRVLKIYQDFPHGRVYVNLQMQLEIHRQISMYYSNYLNEAKEAIFMTASENGDLVFQSFLPFRERLLNYWKFKSLPSPETRDSLMLKTETQLSNSVYVTRCSVDKSLQRIKIRKMIYGKNEVLVNFMDVGIDARIKIYDVYDASKIDVNYARFPSILLKCHLKGIVHLDIAACRKELKHQFSYVELGEPLYDTDDAALVPEVNVYVNSKEGRLMLNEKLITEGFGVPEITKDQFSLFRKSETRLAPSNNKHALQNPVKLNGIVMHEGSTPRPNEDRMCGYVSSNYQHQTCYCRF
ncbi:unnamed protein product [Allacma fusca]|uniref:Uncharacterized protein n=1 Tax=Allacma fusca TaxID=39272 RepID=A0A8J2JMG8_9HEXA|nr:unnamed protein product [Allacma fusca]